jgi:PAS domain S-box-containing protein
MVFVDETMGPPRDSWARLGTDCAGLVNEWNNKSVEITGFSREEVMGKSLVDVYITEDFRESVKSVFDDALNGKLTANFEFPIFTKDKRRIEVLLNATTRCNVKGEVLDPDSKRVAGLCVQTVAMFTGHKHIPDCHYPCCRCSRGSHGQAIGVLGVGQDITERKKVELEKALVAQDFQTFIDTANAPIIGIDHNGLVNEWNNMTVLITGFSREEVMGQDLVKVYITEEFRDQVSMVLTNALGGQETANFEFPLFTKNQQRVEVPSGPSARSRTFPTAPEPS